MAQSHSIISCARVKKGDKEQLVILNGGPKASKLEVPFNAETIERLGALFNDHTKFLVIDQNQRRYSIPKKQWEELPLDEAIHFGIYGRET